MDGFMIDESGMIHCIINPPTKEQKKLFLNFEKDGLAERVIFSDRNQGNESRTDVYIHTSSAEKREKVQKILKDWAYRGLM